MGLASPQPLPTGGELAAHRYPVRLSPPLGRGRGWAYCNVTAISPITTSLERVRTVSDLSFFCLCGVYALSVIDAYVDAELSVFDISKDLSLRVEPTIINTHASNNPFDAASIGLQCSVNF